MNKQDFLSKLEISLKNNNIEDYDSIVEYYSELIEDKLESKKLKEIDVIKEFNIDSIVKNVKIEKQLDKASKKPTLSNGIKSLIAVLSVLSLPLLIPAIILAFALCITAGALLFAMVAVIGSLIISGIAIIIALIVAVVVNHLPLPVAILILGISIVVLVLLIELFIWIFKMIKNLIVWFIESLKRNINKRGMVNSHE